MMGHARSWIYSLIFFLFSYSKFYNALSDESVFDEVTSTRKMSTIELEATLNYYDCCSFRFNSLGVSCQRGIEVNNITYVCVESYSSCEYCKLNNVTSSGSCYSCCVESGETCAATYYHVASGSWTIICIIFAGSCCCCTIVFLSAEHTRIKEGISFREAYLLPIPLVAAEVDVENKASAMPPDQPTAIARMTSTVDVVVAEPTETSQLIGYQIERNSIWE